MTVAAAADERVITLKKKSGSAATNWSTDDASAPGSGDAVLVTSPVNIQRSIEKKRDESMGGETAQSGVLNGGVKTEFSIEQELFYEDASGHLPFAMCLGTSGGSPSEPSPTTGATVRDQNFTPALNVNGIVATACEGPTASHGTDQPSIADCPSAMCRAFEISGESDGIVKVSSQWVGIDAFQVPAPTDDPLDSDITLNATRALVAAATIGSSGNRLRMGDAKFYIDDNDGSDDFAGGSGSSYVVQISRFRLRFERAWDMTYGSQAGSAPDSVSRLLMPVNTAQQLIPSLQVQLPRWESDAYFGEWATNVAKRIRLEFTGSTIETGYTYRFRMDFPLAKPWEFTKDAGGNITQNPGWDLYTASSTPTGFSSTDAVRLDVRNTQTSDILA